MGSGDDDLYRSAHLKEPVGGDILDLNDVKLQRVALTRIQQLVRGEIWGGPLTPSIPGYPDLSDCYKVYFDTHESKSRALQYRIVYRFLDPVPGLDRRLRLQVVAVGPRLRYRVYDLAGNRLRRPDLPRHALSGESARREQMYVAAHLSQQLGADLGHLQDSQLQKMAMDLIEGLLRGTIEGRWLRPPKHGQRDLSGCFDLRFARHGGDLEESPYSIVYRFLDPKPGADRRLRLQVIAVGERSQNRIYDTAGIRLSRRIVNYPVVHRAKPLQRSAAPPGKFRGNGLRM